MSASVKFVRAFSHSSSSVVKETPELLQKAKAMVAHDEKATQALWKRLSLFLAVPMIGISCLNSYLHSKEHAPRPEFIPYEHLRIREKRFAWGDGNHSFFHNPHTNPLPDGYEE